MGEVRTTEAILEERGGTHGPYWANAGTCQELKELMASKAGWQRLNYMQRESLHMIAHKIARILSGDPCHHDHWDDIAGYATLVSKNLPDHRPGTPEDGGHHEPQ